MFRDGLGSAFVRSRICIKPAINIVAQWIKDERLDHTRKAICELYEIVERVECGLRPAGDVQCLFRVWINDNALMQRWQTVQEFCDVVRHVSSRVLTRGFTGPPRMRLTLGAARREALFATVHQVSPLSDR
ncbi:MAG: hypothetical protein KDA74_15115 [Planctomycetaceae bacterium]|nr:hypothetical protein [Planctomycetaceae bacterium]